MTDAEDAAQEAWLRWSKVGPAIRARVLSGGEWGYAAEMLARKNPILHGVLIPLVHRLRGNQTMHIELTPVAS